MGEGGKVHRKFHIEFKVILERKGDVVKTVKTYNLNVLRSLEEQVGKQKVTSTPIY